MMRFLTVLFVGLVALWTVPPSTVQAREVLPATLEIRSFGVFFGRSSEEEIRAGIANLEANWNDGLYPQLIEITSYSGNALARQHIFDLLQRQSGEDIGPDFQAWYQWLWNRPEVLTSDYGHFKAAIYRAMDPRFFGYFAGRQETAQIRLDEIRWGGVRQDGIPPLRQPEMIAAAEASYLDASNIVFGIEINGDARAYPKRILAWHEMFVDTIGGEEIAGVYCTLCGTVIPYKTTFNGTRHALGTSGFLYRSNKLMYDEATQSLWSTMEGEPVMGPLVGQGIRLEHLSVVTTTWEEWQRRHPDTTVLSLNTGHRRNYGEGVAYNAYFATDELMFGTPFNNTDLANKQEVLGLRFPGAPQDQLAIDTAFLAGNPVYETQVGLQDVLILTDQSGANRVYDPQGLSFVSYDGDVTVTDSMGEGWVLTEDGLTASDGRILPRLPAHRAFWFGWYAAFPETQLIK